jgi:hypothetical protein
VRIARIDIGARLKQSEHASCTIVVAARRMERCLAAAVPLVQLRLGPQQQEQYVGGAHGGSNLQSRRTVCLAHVHVRSRR